MDPKLLFGVNKYTQNIPDWAELVFVTTFAFLCTLLLLHVCHITWYRNCLPDRILLRLSDIEEGFGARQNDA